MTLKRLAVADNYFIFPFSDGHSVGVSKNGICYRIDESGELIPTVCGDELTVLHNGKTAVRKAQKISIIN